MNRRESDREDLMKEAVALVERTELCLPDFSEPVTAGFRTDGSLSLFFGQDPVYHFDPHGRLRRAYVSGYLYRSEPPTLAQLKRSRTETQTLLLRTMLSEPELADFQRRMRERLSLLRDGLHSGTAVVRVSVPESTDLCPKLLASLQSAEIAEPWLSAQIRRRT